MLDLRQACDCWIAGVINDLPHQRQAKLRSSPKRTSRLPSPLGRAKGLTRCTLSDDNGISASEGSRSAGAPPTRRVSSSTPGSGSSAPIDPILRNTLRYTVSAREYATLHKYILSRSRLLRRNAPSPGAVDKALSAAPSSGSTVSKKKVGGSDDYNARAVRHALRVFAATWVGMKGWEAISRRMSDKEYVLPVMRDSHDVAVILTRNGSSSASGKKQPFYKSPSLRLSLSLSTILLLYRFLFRFLSRLRAHLMDPQAEPFRRRILVWQLP